jgi:hypothetical protein
LSKGTIRDKTPFYEKREMKKRKALTYKEDHRPNEDGFPSLPKRKVINRVRGVLRVSYLGVRNFNFPLDSAKGREYVLFLQTEEVCSLFNLRPASFGSTLYLRFANKVLMTTFTLVYVKGILRIEAGIRTDG